MKAAPEGYTAAGKTGTAQVLDPQTRRYASNKYTSIFTGFIPADRPRLAISVVIHEPHGANYGGVVAAPVFRNIAAKALPYLGVFPTPGQSFLPPGVHLAGTAQNKACESRPLRPRRKAWRELCSHSRRMQRSPARGRRFPQCRPNCSPGQSPSHRYLALEAMNKPKAPVDLVMTRVP